ncbi:MAG: molybdopterin-dependent oxidoreductase, partial [Pelagibacteraceae bacterium]
EKNHFKLLYLVGSDNLHIKKNNEFIIYQGSHGDKNAAIADVILPSAAYTEQDGLFTNIEGRVQECRKASYPTNEAKEDWQIFNLISKNLYNTNLFSDLHSIRNIIFKNIPNFSEIDHLPIKKIKNEIIKLNAIGDEKIAVKPIDYYFSNSIARASKTMSDCRNILLDIKKNGTNN